MSDIDQYWLLEQDPEASLVLYDLCLLNGWAGSDIYYLCVPQAFTGAASHSDRIYQSLCLGGINSIIEFNAKLHTHRSWCGNRYAVLNY
jgi:hypothetical protein